MRTARASLLLPLLFAVACSRAPRDAAILAFPDGAVGWERIADAATARGSVTLAPLPADSRDAVVAEVADLPTFLWPPTAGAAPADAILLDAELALPAALPHALGAAVAARLRDADLAADATVEVLTTDRAAPDTVDLLRGLVEGLGEPAVLRLTAVHEADGPQAARAALDPAARGRPAPAAVVVLDAGLLGDLESVVAPSCALILAPRDLAAPDPTPARAWTVHFPLADYVDRLLAALHGRRDRSREALAPRWLAPRD